MSSIAKSTRASCAVAQNPDFDSLGTLVVAMATIMSLTSGIAARCVISPTISSVPQTISTTPTTRAGGPALTRTPASRTFATVCGRNVAAHAVAGSTAQSR